jgi:uncharacterized protein with von Willebrand factor type A (vWA) domain
MLMESDSHNNSPVLVRNRLAKILAEDLRPVISVPRMIPRTLREDIAEIIASDLILDQPYEIRDTDRFIEKFGAFYPIFQHIRHSDLWDSVRELSRKCEAGGVRVAGKILEEIFSILDTEPHPNSPKALKSSSALAEEFASILEDTRDLWGRKPGEPDYPGEKLVTLVSGFLEMDGTCEFLEEYLEEANGRIESVLQETVQHAETLATLALLFPGRGWDLSLKELQREYFANLELYAKILAKNPDLKKILDLLGRIKLEYGSRRLTVSPLGKSEVHSLTRSHDVQHMIPSEAIKLKHPVLKRKFFADMMEGKLLTYALQGTSWVGGPPRQKRKGPVVALVDTSGSMHGSPECLAKAVILAIAKKMLPDHRDVRVILFSGTGQTRSIELTKKEKMASEFLQFLASSFSGGTDFNTALKSGLESLKQPEFKGADLMFITDGMAALSDKNLTDNWKKVKSDQDARVFSMIIGNDNAGGLQPISDYVFFVQNDRHWTLEQGPSGLVRILEQPIK